MGVGTTGRLTANAAEGTRFGGAGLLAGAGTADGLAATAAGGGGAELWKTADQAAVISR